MIWLDETVARGGWLICFRSETPCKVLRGVFAMDHVGKGDWSTINYTHQDSWSRVVEATGVLDILRVFDIDRVEKYMWHLSVHILPRLRYSTYYSEYTIPYRLLHLLSRGVSLLITVSYTVTHVHWLPNVVLKRSTTHNTLSL